MVLLDPIPEEYYEWWYSVGECLGETKDFNSVEYYIVPGVYEFECFDSLKCEGTHQDGRIILAGEMFLDSYLVSHEQIHSYGYPDHKSEAFNCSVVNERRPCRYCSD